MRGHRHYTGVLLMGLAILGATFVVPFVHAAANTSDTIAFQARILSKDRLSAPSGTFSFKFSLYTAESSGSALWTEQWSAVNKLEVRHGLFTANLGSLTPLASSLFTNNSLYLTVEFDADNDGSFDQLFLSRIPVTAVPYALSAGSINGKTVDQLASTDSTYLTLSNSDNLSNERLLKGTDNQIILSDGGANGNATLSLPQSIATSSAVQFGSLGIGTSVAGSASMMVNEVSGNTGDILVVKDRDSNRQLAINQFAELAMTADGLGNSVIRIKQYGESDERFIIKGNGALQWGDGTARDTNLYRSTTDTLKTDDALIVGTTLTVNGTAANLLAQSELRLYDADSSNYLGFKAPTTVASNLVWTLPSADGRSGQCLSTNAGGTLSWTACAGGSGSFTAAATSGTNSTISSGGTLTLTAGTDITTTGNGSGSITVADASTLLSVTGRGASTSNMLTLTGGIYASGSTPDPYRWIGDISTTDINGMIGINLQPTISSNRNVGALTGSVISKPYIGAGISVPGAYTHLYVYNATLNSGASLATQYGLYVQSLTSATNNYAIYLAGTGASNGITLGGDTNLYRSAANILKTDDQLNVTDGLTVTTGVGTRTADSTVIDNLATGSSGGQRSRLLAVGKDTSTNGNIALATARSDATNYYEPLQISGSTLAVSFPSALSSTSALIIGGDTNLYRSAANVLKTDDHLQTLTGLLVGDSADVLTDRSAFIYENASTSSPFYGTVSTAINAGTGDSIGVLGTSYIVNVDAGGDGIGLYGEVIGSAADGSTVTNASGLYSKNAMGFVPTTNSYGLNVANPTGSAISNNYGVYIADQTIGTSTDYGLTIAGADTLALWIGSGADNTDAANGIAFGSSKDTNLYRSAANTLKTDDSLVIAGTSADLLTQGDLRFYDSDSSNYVGFQAPATVGTNMVWTLPNADGGAGECLATNAGALSWAACGGGSGAPTTSQYLTLALDGTLSAERILTGTANQIILTDGGANGNLTLSTPQNIATTSTPQFARLGLGQAANTYILSVPTATTATGGFDFGGAANLYSPSSGALANQYSAANNGGAIMTLRKSRGSIGSEAIVNASDTVGTLGFQGYDGTTWQNIAQIIAAVDGTPGAGDMPGSLFFKTTADGGTTLTTALKIDTAQKLWIGSTADTNLYRGAANELHTDDLLAFSSSKAATDVDLKSYKPDATGAQFIFDTSATVSTASLLVVRNNTADRLVLNAAGQLQLPTQGSTGGIVLGGDASFYRSAVGTIRTDNTQLYTQRTGAEAGYFRRDDSARAVSLYRASNTATDNTSISFRLNDSAGIVTEEYAYIGGVIVDPTDTAETGALIFGTRSGNSAALERMRLNSDGKLYLGTDVAIDTNLYRSAASTLTSDGSFNLSAISSRFAVGNGAQVHIGANIAPTFSDNAITTYGINSGPTYGNTPNGIPLHVIASVANNKTVVTLPNLYIAQPILGSGSSITTNYGIFVADMSVGGTNHGLYFNGSGTANEIIWQNDTNLYRSAANTLKTDDSLVVGSALNVTGTTTLATSLTGILKASSGVVSAAAADSDYQQVIAWGNGLTYSAGTADVDYNTTNLKITSTQLNTIQDIATTSTPQFARLGLGQAASSTSLLAGTATFTNQTGGATGYDLTTTFSPAGDLSGATTVYGYNSIATFNSTHDALTNSGAVVSYSTQASTASTASGNLKYLYGNAVSAKHFGTGTVQNLYGVSAGIYNDDTNSESGNITSAYNFLASSYTDKTTGTIGARYGLYVEDTNGGGNLTNQYGVYIAAQTGAGTSDVGLYIGDADTYSLQLASTDGDAASGITFGTDTNLYRSGANNLKSDDALTVVGSLNTPHWYSTTNTATADEVISMYITGDTQYRYKMTADGAILWGPGGSTVGDTNLYRGAANELRTDDLLSFGSGKTNTTTDFKTYKGDGGVGFIFDTSSTYSTGSLLSVRNNGTPKFAINNNGNVTMAGTLTQSGTPADLAENVAVSDPSIVAGDIVTADPANPGTMRKATNADYAISGVISTEPGILLSGATAGKPLVLAGRVPVKVTNANGLIHAGDVIIPSATPGRGQRGGDVTARMIGIALSNQSSPEDTITVQLQIGFYSPTLGSTSNTNALSPQQQAVLGAISLLSDNVLGVHALSVDTLTVTEALYVNGTAVFAQAPVFPTNTTGIAMVPAGQQSVEVVFSPVHTRTPNITVTVSTDNLAAAADLAAAQYAPIVVHPSTTGFTIMLAKPATTDVPLSWIALTSQSH